MSNKKEEITINKFEIGKGAFCLTDAFDATLTHFSYDEVLDYMQFRLDILKELVTFIKTNDLKDFATFAQAIIYGKFNSETVHKIMKLKINDYDVLTATEAKDLATVLLTNYFLGVGSDSSSIVTFVKQYIFQRGRKTVWK